MEDKNYIIFQPEVIKEGVVKVDMSSIGSRISLCCKQTARIKVHSVYFWKALERNNLFLELKNVIATHFLLIMFIQNEQKTIGFYTLTPLQPTRRSQIGQIQF